MEQQKSKPKKSRLDRFLENKLWKAIQIFAPLAAIFITIYIFIVSQHPAEITVRGEDCITLLAPQTDLRKDVKIIYDNNEIANIAKYTLLVQNNTKRDIDGQDIHYLRWYPPEYSTILNAEVTKKSSRQGDFVSVYSKRNNVLEIKLDTLNRGVFFVIEVLCSSTSPEPDISTCRAEGVIAGGSVIEENMRFLARPNKSFIENVFAGGLWENLAKLLIYSLASMLVIVLIVMPFTKIYEFVKEQKREQKRQKALEEIPDGTDEVKRFMIWNDIELSHRKDIEDTFIFFSKLTQSEIKLCRRAISTWWGAGVADYILSKKNRDPLGISGIDANTN